MAVAAHLVGRAEELDSLDHLLAALDAGRVAAVEVVGEPGIGKTRLLAELADRARARGHLVLSGSASELERDLPFGVFVDALDEYLQGLEPHRLDGARRRRPERLASVFPSLAGLATSQGERIPARAIPQPPRRPRAPRTSTARTPLVLVLDDVHWADSGISRPARLAPPAAPRRRRPCSSLALRPRQVPERLAAALEPARRAGTLARLELDALTRAEAGELLGSTVDEPTAAALYEDSGGNPFYLEQLGQVASARHRSSDRHAHELARQISTYRRCVAAALAEELALLSDDARARCYAARPSPAIPSTPSSPRPQPRSTGRGIRGVDELLRLDLIRETDVPRRFRFRHPLVRRAVYESAPGGWRLGAHERCADALAARGVGPAERAHHVERAGRQGDATAVATLREAGMRRPIVRPQAPRTGSPSRFDSRPTTPPQASASSCCSRARER